MAGLLNGTARLGKDKFLSDPDVRDATIYRLQTLAESSQRLSNAFKNAHPEVPWMTSEGSAIGLSMATSR